MSGEFQHGATLENNGACTFRVWAPDYKNVELQLISPITRTVNMQASDCGYFEMTVDGIEGGQRYLYSLDGADPLPDPASRSQPDGVHGPSVVVARRSHAPTSIWTNPKLRDYVIYELHIGTFSPEGTFGGAIPYLEELRDLGITAVELMPIAQFPGARNWGYDGVFPYAAQSTYGGPAGLRKLVDACHTAELAVVLDVVYNHLGPEGNYLARFGPYFSTSYTIPWGQPINFDGPGSDEVRRYFTENALYWTDECEIDALRLDAIHAIFDPTAYPFLAELSDQVHDRARSLGRTVHLIAESGLNDPRVCWTTDDGGLGMDGMWSDDFHHSLRVALTGEQAGYYLDFTGIDDLQIALEDGHVYQGQHSHFRGRKHGRSPDRLNPEQMVIFSQNHDQVGNRARGDRLGATVDFESLKLAAGVILLSPYTPLLFMGEEYAEAAPFPFFVDHGDPNLVEAVRVGRLEEFPELVAAGGTIPDPGDPATFESAKLNRSLKQSGRHRVMLDFYRELLRLRGEEDLITSHSLAEAELSDSVLIARRSADGRQLTCLFNFSAERSGADSPNLPHNQALLMYSAERRWGGPVESSGQAISGDTVVLEGRSFALFTGNIRER